MISVSSLQPRALPGADADLVSRYMLSAVPYTKRFLIVGIALFAGFSARAQDLTPKPSVGDTLLDPSSIAITGHFEAPSHASAAFSVFFRT